MASDSSTTAAPAGPGAYLQPLGPAIAEDDALDQILQGMVAGVTGLPGHLVRPRFQLVPSPMPEATVDWCGVGTLDDDPENGLPSHRHSGSGGPVDGFDTMYEVTVLNVQASFYGPNCVGNAKKLRRGLSLAQNREALYFFDLGLVEIPDKIVQTGDVINGRTVTRADLSIRLRRNMVTTWPIDNILEAVGGIVSDDGQAAPIDVVFPVP